MPDAVPQGRKVGEGRECMASDWGLESGRSCKHLQENGTSPPRIYRREKYRNDKEVSELKMYLCFGFYTPMTNILFNIPRLSKRSSILFWAAAVLLTPSASQTPLRLGGTGSTSGQWDVSRARWVGLWAITPLGLWPSALHSLSVEMPVTPAALFYREKECWTLVWKKYWSSPYPWWFTQQTAHYHLPATSLLFIMWVIPCLKPLFVGSSLRAAKHNPC